MNIENITCSMKKISDFLFTYNIYVFFIYITVSFLFLHSSTNFNTNFSSSLSILIANILLIIGTYTLNKLSDTKEDSVNYSTHYDNNNYYYHEDSQQKNILLLLCFMFFTISFILYLSTNNIQITTYWLLMFTLSIVYSYPKKYRLKKKFLLKNITSAFSWFFSISVLLSVSNNTLLINSMKIALPIFFLVLIVEILWDMPDILGDKREEIKTLPVVLGFKITKIIISFLLVFFFLFTDSSLNKTICLILFIFTLHVSEKTKKSVYHYLIFFLTIILYLNYFIN